MLSTPEGPGRALGEEARQNFFGDKNLVNADAKHKLIHRCGRPRQPDEGRPALDLGQIHRRSVRRQRLSLDQDRGATSGQWLQERIHRRATATTRCRTHKRKRTARRALPPHKGAVRSKPLSMRRSSLFRLPVSWQASPRAFRFQRVIAFCTPEETAIVNVLSVR
jgi:hypothetical protein